MIRAFLAVVSGIVPCFLCFIVLFSASFCILLSFVGVVVTVVVVVRLFVFCFLSLALAAAFVVSVGIGTGVGGVVVFVSPVTSCTYVYRACLEEWELSPF